VAIAADRPHVECVSLTSLARRQWSWGSASAYEWIAEADDELDEIGLAPGMSIDEVGSTARFDGW